MIAVARPRVAVFRRPLRIALELAAMLAILVTIHQLWADHDIVTQYQPLTFWLPVIVVAATYGSWPGLAGCVASTSAWLASNRIDPAAGDTLDYMFAISLPPLFWFASAVVLGEVTDHRRRKISILEDGKHASKRNMKRLIKAFHKLAENNRLLQLRITTEERSVGDALGLAASLCVTADGERQVVLRRMIALACDSGDFTCYRMQSGRAWPILFGDDCSAQAAALPEGLVLALHERQAAIHVARPQDRALLANVGMIAVPLLSDDMSHLVGALVLHHLPFARLGPHLSADLAALAGWLTAFVADSRLLGNLAVVRDHGS